MAGSSDNPQNSFTAMGNEGGSIPAQTDLVRETPKFDLDLYIQNYRGRTRFERLFLIGRWSEVLGVDALKAAVIEAKKGKDVYRYRDAWELLYSTAPSEPEAHFDKAWVDVTEKSNKAETYRLETELKGYKNNLVKESIRMGHEDLGKHLESIGELGAASETYARMRPDVSTSKQIIDVGKHLVSISVQRKEWPMVTASLNKMTGLQSGEDEKAIQPYLKIMHGIALIGQEKYYEAALSFLQTDPAPPSNAYIMFASPNDVAVYGGLLALATMDRATLQNKVLNNLNFRTFLELEPQIRRAITQFVSGRYSACLEILESYRADYLLDVYLQKHVPAIYSQIRSKCIVQYLIPFSCVTIDSLKAAFEVSERPIENELVGMIKTGTLRARIDTIDKLVTSVSVNPRVKMQTAGLKAAEKYEKEALERIRRMSIAAAELEVRGTKRGSAAVNDTWYEEGPRPSYQIQG